VANAALKFLTGFINLLLHTHSHTHIRTHRSPFACDRYTERGGGRRRVQAREKRISTLVVFEAGIARAEVSPQRALPRVASVTICALLAPGACKAASENESQRESLWAARKQSFSAG
jgi:hypothetical protein